MFRKLRTLSLKAKLIILFLLVGLVPLAVVGFLSYNNAAEGIRYEVFQGKLLYAHIVDADMESYFREQEAAARVLVANNNIHETLSNLVGVAWDTNDPQWMWRASVLQGFLPTVVEEHGWTLAFLTDVRGTSVFDTSGYL